MFMDKLMGVVNKHAPLWKRTIRSNRATWLDNELKSLMLQRDKAKDTAQQSENYGDRKTYCKLRNQLKKCNHFKKREYFKQKICDATNDSKKLWKTLNVLMVKGISHFQSLWNWRGNVLPNKQMSPTISTISVPTK